MCYLVTLTGTGEGVGQSQQEGCGNQTYTMPPGLGANAVVAKRSGKGALTAIVTVGGKETARQTTDADFGIVTVGRT